MIIKKVKINQFRAIQNPQEFSLGKSLTAIVGRNKTMKSTLLGVISQTFSIPKNSPMHGARTLDGYNFKSQFGEKFKFDKNEKAGQHSWEMLFEEGIHHINPFPIKSIERNKDGNIRFWYEKSKKAGTGYVQIPVYFLSLGRLFPVGESDVNHRMPPQLVIKDKLLQDAFAIAYEKILSDNDIDKVVLQKDRKATYSGVIASKYSFLTNSAGQSNTVRIINAVLSFAVLKQKFKDYKGGILLIDEIDATLHPHAQKALIDFLHDSSKKYQIQIIFTTHSSHVIDSVKNMVIKDKTNSHNKVLFLRNKDNSVSIETIENIGGFNRIDSNLNLEEYEPAKIKVYCEDEVGVSLAKKCLSPKIKKRLDFQKITFGFGEYLKMHKQNFAGISNALLILDGDIPTRAVKNDLAYIKEQKNILILPGGDCPEIEFYKMLKNETDAEFETIYGIEKSICFKDFVISEYNSKAIYSERRDFAKRFFYQCRPQLKAKIMSDFIKKNKVKVDKFNEDTQKAFDLLAKNLQIELIG